MRLVPRFTPRQWLGSAMMAIGCVGMGLFGALLIPRPDAIPSVPIGELGLAADHVVKSQLVAAQMPPFQLIGAAEDNSGKNVRLWDAVIQLRGEHLPNVPQQIGDCVSWGAANAVNYLQAVQIIRGPPAEFHPAFPPYIYGTSRVEVGRKHGSHFRGDGSVGAYAAEALQEYGVLRADHEQCPPYSGTVARQWGASGPPAWAKDVAKAYLVQSVAPVKSAQEAMDAIAGAHCPVTIASSWWGTTDIPVVNGRRVARRNTSWAHQQCLVAYDGSGSERLFYCVNSWGPNAHPAPLQGEPPGGYWIRWADVDRICREGDSWALSAFDGFPAAGPDWDELLRRPTTAAVAPIQHGPNDGGGMMVPWMGLVACLCLAGLGLLLFRMARRDKSALGMIAPMLMSGLLFGSVSVGSAQDFEAASQRVVPAVDFAAITSPATVTTPSERDQIWATAARRAVGDPLLPSGHQVITDEPQALVFYRSVGCSACDKLIGYLKTLSPKKWTVGEQPDVYFRLIDVQKQPEIARLYGVEVVPTTVYLNRCGRIVERRLGFDLQESWTAPLITCR